MVTLSAQATIFFGRETHMGIQVVLKQYRGETFEEIFRELKLYTLIENKRMERAGNEIKNILQ